MPTDPTPAALLDDDLTGPSWRALWQTTDAAGFLAARAGGALGRSPQERHTGNRLERVVAPGHVVFRWEPGEAVLNMAGAVHGGYVALVLDEATGLSAASTGERFLPMLTVELSLQFLRPALAGQTYEVHGEVLHRGGRRIVSDGRILDSDSRLVAAARGSFLPNTAFAERMAEQG